MARSIYGDKERYKKTYWSDYPGIYTAGDGARRDKEGNFWIIGRLDDVLNVSGHRLGTAEIESALVSHLAVAEAAVIGRPHEMKGQAVAAFVTLKGGFEESPELWKELISHVGRVIGAIAKPDDLYFAPGLPKTRSGKIMRRLLKELVCNGAVTGNVTTLEDFTVIEALQKKINSSAVL
jgi:acetyl-CoA synthetase